MMTPSQLTALKADMVGASSVALSAFITAGDWQSVAAYYNGASATNVWRPDASVDQIKGAILWANLTPADAPDGTIAWQCRSLACQGKQFNLQLMLGQQAGGTCPGDLSAFRSGLQDALTNIPAGAAGALLGGGWSAVQPLLRRPGTRFEVALSTVDGAANKTSVYGQQVSSYDCVTAYTQG